MPSNSPVKNGSLDNSDGQKGNCWLQPLSASPSLFKAESASSRDGTAPSVGDSKSASPGFPFSLKLSFWTPLELNEDRRFRPFGVQMPNCAYSMTTSRNLSDEEKEDFGHN